MYVYKAIREGTVVYIGITKDINTRMKSHKLNAEWWNEKIEILYTKLPNRFIAETYEVYFINKFAPQYNKKDKRGDDVSLLNFQEDNFRWEKFIFDECIKREISTYKNKYKSNLTGIPEEIALNFFVNNKSNITEVYYDKNKVLCIIFNEASKKEFLDLKHKYGSYWCWTFDGEQLYSINKFNETKMTGIPFSFRDDINILTALEINPLSLDKNEGVIKDKKRIEEIEKYFFKLFTQNHAVVLKNILSTTSLKTIKPHSLINNLEVVFNEGSGYYILKYKKKKRCIFYDDYLDDGFDNLKKRDEWLREWCWYEKQNDGYAFELKTLKDFYYFWYLLKQSSIKIGYQENDSELGLNTVDILDYDDLLLEQIIE